MSAAFKPSSGPDDSPFDPADPTRPAKAPNPKDAATLILIRRTRGHAEVLMGQRSKGHVFMPDKWVFPGGRLDRTDGLAPAATELDPHTDEKLKLHCKRKNPRAFALAAIRETFEEAGLVVGRKGGVHGPWPAGWEDYGKCEAAPELDKLAFVARAITPPYRPRRFDARFFMADAEAVLLDDRPVITGEELLHTKWFTFDDAEKLDLPSVTRFVIGEVRARLAGEESGGPPFLRFTRGGHRMDRL